MKKQALITIIGFAMLSGCVNSRINEYQSWEDNLSARAEAGEIAWTDYYDAISDKVIEMPYFRSYNVVLNYAITMRDHAERYEAGDMPEDEFHFVRRYNQKVLDAALSNAKAENTRRLGEALQRSGEAMQGNDVYCTSNTSGSVTTTRCR